MLQPVKATTQCQSQREISPDCEFRDQMFPITGRSFPVIAEEYLAFPIIVILIIILVRILILVVILIIILIILLIITLHDCHIS